MYYPFIPAYAGHTHPLPGGSGGRDFHPRIRGAHGQWAGSAPTDSLSSPHTRGTLEQCDGALAGCPFIPAYAGHTDSRYRPRCRSTFHPRIRGAHPGSPEVLPPASPFIPAYAGHTGWHGVPQLSAVFHPRIRGAHLRPGYPNVRGNPFIPAYAGHTGCKELGIEPTSFHPRIRGAHLFLLKN